MAAVRTHPLTRFKLGQVFRSPEEIRVFEDLTGDVGQVLPTALLEVQTDVEKRVLRVTFYTDKLDATADLREFLLALRPRLAEEFGGDNNNSAVLSINCLGRSYALSGPIAMDGEYSGIEFANFAFYAEASSEWVSGGAMFQIGDGGAKRIVGVGLVNGRLNCKKLTNGVLFSKTNECYAHGVGVYGQKEFGFHADTGSNRRLSLTRCVAQEFGTGDPTSYILANRTSAGFWIESTDGVMSECVAPICAIGGKFDNIRNFLVSGFHPFMGLLTDDADKRAASTVLLGSLDPEDQGASGVQFSACYFDHGTVRMANSFAHQFDTCTWTGGETDDGIGLDPFTAIAVEPDADACGLKIVDARISKEHKRELIDWQTDGAGSWSAHKLHQILATSAGSAELMPSKLMSSIHFIDSSQNGRSGGSRTEHSKVIIGQTADEFPIAGGQGNFTVNSIYDGAGFSVTQWGNPVAGPGIRSAVSRSVTPGTFGGFPMSGDILLRIVASGDNGTDLGTTNNPGASVAFSAADDWSATSTPTEILFRTTAIGSTGDAVRRFSISDAGHWLPFTDAVYSAGSASKQFAGVYSTGYFVAANQVVGPRNTGWTAGTGTATKGAFATGTATATQVAERVLAIEQAMRTHGLID